MKCPYLKTPNYCTHAGNFSNQNVKNVTCVYKNCFKCPILKGDEWSTNYDKHRVEKLKMIMEPIPRLDSGRKDAS